MTKQLIHPFGFNEIVEECKRQFWRLPTEEEAKEITPDTGYGLMWIQHAPHKDERLHFAYSHKGREVVEVHKLFKLQIYVIKLTDAEICQTCLHFKGGAHQEECYACRRYYSDGFTKVVGLHEE